MVIYDINLLQIGNELAEIIKKYKDGSEEALDGDEVDVLVGHLKNQINLTEGNITEKEYRKLEGVE